jgi:hypothetical protein
MKKELYIYLGFVGHKANEFQKLFSEFTIEPNQYGYFAKFENYSELECNKGVYVHTNCFESEEVFYEIFNARLLWYFIENSKK